MSLLEEIATALKSGDIERVGKLTNRNFAEPLQKIIPWCSNSYTERLIELSRAEFGDDFWGFWMLGGMAGGGMGFLFAPSRKAEATAWLAQSMLILKRELEQSLPFAMDPVVYEFEINDAGTTAELRSDATLPTGYYELIVPTLIRQDIQSLSPARRRELEHVGQLCRDNALGDRDTRGSASGDGKLAERLLDRLLPGTARKSEATVTVESLLAENGFDRIAHQQIREDLLNGRLGLSQNRLSSVAQLEDVYPEDILDARRPTASGLLHAAEEALAKGQVAVLTLAAGVGSRWTQGAGVVKALHPFCKLAGRHRTFLEMHLAKSRRIGKQYGKFPTHIFSSGYLTDGPIRRSVESLEYPGKVLVSRGKSVGLRMIPTARDLHFAWEDMPQQLLDEQQEKMRQSARAALLGWAIASGETADYTDNLPMQCLHPVGHWYEVPNLMRNGVLRDLLREQPELRYLLLHNVDTLGATVDPHVLALHMTSGACLSFEVITRRLEDRGGGLARVDGRVRLVEGLAMPNEEEEFKLSFYNSLTTWIDIDRLLETFGLSRGLLDQPDLVDEAVRRLGRRMPTYITLKDVKKRWGNGQEDVFPVSQFEKLWGDMTALPEVDCQFIAVPTLRGQQLKEQAQLDGWLRDGSAKAIEKLCEW